MVDIDTLMNFLEKEYPSTSKWKLAVIRKLLTVKPKVKPYKDGEIVTRKNCIPGDKEVTLNYGFYKNPKGDIIEPLFEEPYYEYCFKENERYEAYAHLCYLLDHMKNAEKIHINILVVDTNERQYIVYQYFLSLITIYATSKGFTVIENRDSIEITLIKQRRKSNEAK